MTLSIYFFKKLLKAFFLCWGVSYSFFFIFSLIGNLGEKFSFKLIVFLSILNSFQIFTYIPSHLFILTFCLFIYHLKSKNELIIIKEYIELKKLFILIFPILALFLFVEIKKEDISYKIEKIKLKSISSNLENTKILISSEENKKRYIIFSGYDEIEKKIDLYLSFETQNQTINRGEISSDLNLLGNSLYSNESIIYENSDFRYDSVNKLLFENFISNWSKNNESIIKNKKTYLFENYNLIYSVFFYFLFYLCVSIIFLSKKLLNRSLNTKSIFLFILLVFLYYLFVPKIVLDNFQYIFQVISILIFILIFIQIKKYE